MNNMQELSEGEELLERNSKVVYYFLEGGMMVTIPILVCAYYYLSTREKGNAYCIRCWYQRNDIPSRIEDTVAQEDLLTFQRVIIGTANNLLQQHQRTADETQEEPGQQNEPAPVIHWHIVPAHPPRQAEMQQNDDEEEDISENSERLIEFEGEENSAGARGCKSVVEEES